MPSENNSINLDSITPEKTPSESRIDKVHGGTLVEAIEKPEPMNNPSCEHKWEIDPTEKDFIAYMCVNDNCGIVKLYDK